ncbi:unnamed protein product [Sympodiomycopsis kandeliae]
MSLPSSSSSSSRPAKTALSSKVQGLKFMQRAEARRGVSNSQNNNNASSAQDQESSNRQQKQDANKDSQSGVSSSIVTLDDNPEHWSFASNAGPGEKTRKSSVQEGGSQGWNSWLLDASSSSSSSSSRSKQSKAKKQRRDSSDEEEESVAPVGRRTFGTFVGQGDDDDDDDDGDEGEDPEEDEKNDGAHGRRQARKSLPISGSGSGNGKGTRRPRRDSLEPDVDFDEEGQVMSTIRQQSSKKSHAKSKSKPRSSHDGQSITATSSGFIKPGSMKNGDGGGSEEKKKKKRRKS